MLLHRVLIFWLLRNPVPCALPIAYSLLLSTFISS